MDLKKLIRLKPLLLIGSVGMGAWALVTHGLPSTGRVITLNSLVDNVFIRRRQFGEFLSTLSQIQCLTDDRGSELSKSFYDIRNTIRENNYERHLPACGSKSRRVSKVADKGFYEKMFGNISRICDDMGNNIQITNTNREDLEIKNYFSYCVRKGFGDEDI